MRLDPVQHIFTNMLRLYIYIPFTAQCPCWSFASLFWWPLEETLVEVIPIPLFKERIYTLYTYNSMYFCLLSLHTLYDWDRPFFWQLAKAKSIWFSSASFQAVSLALQLDTIFGVEKDAASHVPGVDGGSFECLGPVLCLNARTLRNVNLFSNTTIVGCNFLPSLTSVHCGRG